MDKNRVSNAKSEKDERIYFTTKDGRIVVINDDFLTTDLIPLNSIDLIVTSPPYNVDIHYESFRDNIPYDKYLEFTEKWLKKALELLKPDGRMCLNIPLDKSKGRREEGFQSVYADVLSIAKRVGWKYFSTIKYGMSRTYQEGLRGVLGLAQVLHTL